MSWGLLTSSSSLGEGPESNNGSLSRSGACTPPWRFLLLHRASRAPLGKILPLTSERANTSCCGEGSARSRARSPAAPRPRVAAQLTRSAPPRAAAPPPTRAVRSRSLEEGRRENRASRAHRPAPSPATPRLLRTPAPATSFGEHLGGHPSRR